VLIALIALAAPLQRGVKISKPALIAAAALVALVAFR